ncbi:MAG: cob(I)alamin adenosyltransferase [Saprospiraceae bacterium]|jgi:cob(I)alamin adenosyltransferase
MKIYTKGGDKGQTSLYGGRRISKDDIRIESYGTIDELNSHVGHLLSVIPLDFDQKELLIEIQNRLFTIGSNLASDPLKDLPVPDLNEEDVLNLENAMDNMDASLEPLRAFVLPGGSVSNSVAHVCRTVTRRAERRMISLASVEEVNPILIKYVNRLSDYFFVVSRYLAYNLKHEETPWLPRKN